MRPTWKTPLVATLLTVLAGPVAAQPTPAPSEAAQPSTPPTESFPPVESEDAEAPPAPVEPPTPEPAPTLAGTASLAAPTAPSTPTVASPSASAPTPPTTPGAAQPSDTRPSSAARRAPRHPWGPPARWRGALDAGTDFPVGVVVRGQVEAPFRLRASTAVGYLPPLYADAINGFLVGVNAYERDTAELIDAALSSSLVLRTHVGFRFVPRLGLFAETGYGLVTLGGSATGAEILEGITGTTAPGSTLGRTFSARSTLHLLDVELGYEWFVRHLHLRVTLGGAFTFAAHTTIEPDFTPSRPALMDEFTTYGEDYLDATYTSYVFTPVLGLHVGYGK